MWRRAKANELRRASEQDWPHPTVARRGALQECVEDVLELALPAQNGRSQRTGKGPIADLELGKPGIAAKIGQRQLQRALVDQHSPDQPVRQLACRQTGRLWRTARPGVLLPLAAALLPSGH
jgi:hypothetical protein